MEEYLKYVKSNNTYLIKKKYLKLKINQTGGSVNHKLYNKIIKSKNRNEAINKEKTKLIKEMTKLMDLNKNKTKEGFISFKFFLLSSQLTTLKQMEEESDFNYDKVINAGELWGKLYINYLL